MCEPAYLAWCLQHGVTVQGVEPAFVEHGWRGVVATRQLADGDVVMSVPQQLLMTVLSAQRDPQLAAQLQRHQLSSHQVLALHLLHEASKGSASFWAPYIQQLPRQYTTLMAWPAEAVRALQLPHAQEAAAAAITKARADWAGARPVLLALGVAAKWASWRAWVWAASGVLSRTMYHPADPPCGCLTPLADLHNYAPPPAPHTPQLARDMQLLLLEEQQQQQQHRSRQHSQVQQQQQECEEPEALPLTAAAAAAPTAPDGAAAAAGGHGAHSAQQAGVGTAGVSDARQQHGASEGGGVTALPLEPPSGTHARECSGSCRRPSDGFSCQDSSGQGPHTRCSGKCSGGSSCAHVPNGAAALALPGDTARTPLAEAAGAAAGAEADRVLDPEAAEAAHAEQPCSSISGDGHFDGANGVYHIVARRSYQPGEQVFLCYGRHTNLELLELYGFLLPDNPHDTAALPLELLQQQLQRALEQQLREAQSQQPAGASRGGSAGRQLLQQQQQRGGWQQPQARVAVEWRAVQLDVAAADCWLHLSGQPSWQLLCALRLAAASPAEARALGYKALSGEPISLSSEVLVLRALADTCTAVLADLAAAPLDGPQRETGKQQPLEAAAALDIEAVAASLDCMVMEAGGGAGQLGTDKCMAALQPAEAPGPLLKNQLQHAQAGKQQQQQEAECMALALSCRQTYTSCLEACVECCMAALSTAAAAAAASCVVG